MNRLSRKWVFGDSVSLQHAKKRREDKTTVDNTMCIICQGRRNKGLFNKQITMTPKHMAAMTARQDDTFRRLHNDSAMETLVENKSSK